MEERENYTSALKLRTSFQFLITIQNQPISRNSRNLITIVGFCFNVYFSLYVQRKTLNYTVLQKDMLLNFWRKIRKIARLNPRQT